MSDISYICIPHIKSRLLFLFCIKNYIYTSVHVKQYRLYINKNRGVTIFIIVYHHKRATPARHTPILNLIGSLPAAKHSRQGESPPFRAGSFTQLDNRLASTPSVHGRIL